MASDENLNNDANIDAVKIEIADSRYYVVLFTFQYRGEKAVTWANIQTILALAKLSHGISQLKDKGQKCRILSC